ncbi:hypothetical protein HJG60_009629 [Phyllostomus discolor]|uniref:Uncharacterized protein n=1 Tax=Phyllostomus discolor TaxID=89673 RepID=A0A833Y470_9CHIR|nr:hypothetical protein HJG60_009629 [Phyllostomus discolor]
MLGVPCEAHGLWGTCPGACPVRTPPSQPLIFTPMTWNMLQKKRLHVRVQLNRETMMSEAKSCKDFYFLQNHFGLKFLVFREPGRVSLWRAWCPVHTSLLVTTQISVHTPAFQWPRQAQGPCLLLPCLGQEASPLGVHIQRG